MVTRHLAKTSRELTDAKLLLTMALDELKHYEEHAGPRRVRKRIRGFFGIPAGVEA
jgi:hypothetical protein